MSESSLATSLVLLIGRHRFDGASYEQLAKLHGVSQQEAQAAWQSCLEQLSAHLARIQERPYRLLSEQDLESSTQAVLALLLDWREKALRDERFPDREHRLTEESMTADDKDKESIKGDQDNE